MKSQIGSNAQSNNGQQALHIFHLITTRAEQNPEAIALFAPGRNPLTYRALRSHVGHIVQTLNGMGVGRNDRVAIVLPNGPEMATAFLAVASGAAQLVFRFGSDGYTVYEGWYIDDIIVDGDGYLIGDANSDSRVDISDAVHLINFVFVPGAPGPIPQAAGNVNCDEKVDISDAVYLINFVFIAGSPPPGDPDNNGTPDC